MLNSVFRYKGFDLSADPVLWEIVFGLQPSVTPYSLQPSVMEPGCCSQGADSSAFEPLGQSHLRELTMKTLFLVALASTRRVVELHALSFQVANREEDVILSSLPEFVAKTESMTNPVAREFRLRSLSVGVGHKDDERLLCPMRALRWYRQRTQADGRPRHLFLSVRDPSRPLSKSALSFFLRETIKVAHASIPEEHCPLLKAERMIFGA